MIGIRIFFDGPFRKPARCRLLFWYGRSRRGPLEARPVGLAGRRDRFAPGATAATRLHARARQGVKD
ncbi:hypothetical protein E2R23_21895 [Burkholderia pseudomallei]|nr:hypothetical protein E2R23_21895 [Burkholderia pseudomallei]